ncbi:MAG: PQQ-binding-like beta-propeller repeat protein [Calditrichia bacterium]
MFAAVWGSPVIADGKVYIGDEDGDIAEESRKNERVDHRNKYGQRQYSTPTFHNGVMYISPAAQRCLRLVNNRFAG